MSLRTTSSSTSSRRMRARSIASRPIASVPSHQHRLVRALSRGRPILPPMPIPMYEHFNDADLEAIFAYLQSIPAIRNKVQKPLHPSAP